MDLSAKNFRGPLLQTLAKLSNYKAGFSVASENAYPGILDMMGLTSIDDAGLNQASGQPQIVKWIQWANNDCRKTGLTELVGRSIWSLTEAGLAEALRLAEESGDMDLDEVAMNMTAQVMSVPAAPSVVEDISYYHSDAYIRKLAIDRTPCFGLHSTHGRSGCSECPLHLECRNHQFTEYARLAALLHDEDQAGTPGAVTPTAPATAPDVVAAPVRRYADLDFSTADLIKNKAEALCQECELPIAKGARCRWVLQLPGQDGGGLFHLDCSGGE